MKRITFFIIIMCLIFVGCKESKTIGGLTPVMPELKATPQELPEPYVMVKKWGARGSGNGQFYAPYGLAIDKYGYIYATDHYYHSVQKFNSNGIFKMKFYTKLGSEKWLGRPTRIVVDDNGYIYVVNNEKCNVSKFNSTGKFIKNGISNNDFSDIDTIAISHDGNLFIVDGQLSKYSSDGKFIKEWCTTDNFDYSGFRDIAIDNNGYMFIIMDDLNYLDGRKGIKKLDSNGKILNIWYFKKEKEYCDPRSIALDKKGYIYITDGNNYVRKFNSSGKFITRWGSKGSGDGQFIEPIGIVVDSKGYVYVADWGNRRIQKFAPNPKYKQNN